MTTLRHHAPEDVARAVRLYVETDARVEAIAAGLGLSKAGFYLALTRWGVPRRGRPGRRAPGSRDRLAMEARAAADVVNAAAQAARFGAPPKPDAAGLLAYLTDAFARQAARTHDLLARLDAGQDPEREARVLGTLARAFALAARHAPAREAWDGEPPMDIEEARQALADALDRLGVPDPEDEDDVFARAGGALKLAAP